MKDINGKNKAEKKNSSSCIKHNLITLLEIIEEKRLNIDKEENKILKMLIILILVLLLVNFNNYSIHKKIKHYLKRTIKKNIISSNYANIYLENCSFIIDSMNYTFSNKFNVVKLEYMISAYDEQKQLIYPSDLSLYKNFHLNCFLEIKNNSNISIYSIAGIHDNKYFKCIEFSRITEEVNFGVPSIPVLFLSIFIFLDDH